MRCRICGADTEIKNSKCCMDVPTKPIQDLESAAHESEHNRDYGKIIKQLIKQNEILLDALTLIASLDYPEHINFDYWMTISKGRCADVISRDTMIARDAISLNKKIKESK